MSLALAVRFFTASPTWEAKLCLRVNLSKKYLPNPAWDPDRTVKVGQVVTHLLDDFHLLFQEVVFPQRWEPAGAEPRACRSERVVEVLLLESCGFHSDLGFTLLVLRRHLHILQEGAAAVVVLPFQEIHGVLMLLFVQFMKKVAHVL